MTAVGDLLELAYGKALKDSDRDGGDVPVVGSGGIVGRHSRGITDAPSIVVGRKGSIGSVTWVDGPAWPIDTAYFVRPRENDLDRRWAYWMLKSLRLETMNKSAAVPGLNRDDVYRLEVNLPPLSEQRRIAAILDHVDALRAKRRQLVTHLDALTESIFNDMFGQALATVPLSEAVEEFRYGTSNKSGVAGYPTLRIPNVVGGAIDTSEIKTVDVGRADLRRLTLRDGDLLIVRTNGNPDNVGRAAVFSGDAVGPAGFGGEPWIYASYLIRARLMRSFVPVFVATYLATSDGRKQLRERAKTSAGQYNINTEALASIRIPDVPPEHQQEFADIDSKVMTQRTRVVRLAAADDELFTSLQARAFSGRL